MPKIQNQNGDWVDDGIHECLECHHLFDAKMMQYTTPPKVCIGCYELFDEHATFGKGT